MAFYYPKLYREYAENMVALCEKYPDLKTIYPGAVFAATSTNFGPNAVSCEHVDFGNKANGVCPIFSFGNFDHTRGGHLILRQFKLVVEFPPGALILLPSAALTHGNTPIDVGAGEFRVSFTLYTAGGLFRWVRYGFQKEELLKDDDAKWAEELAARKTRWKLAVNSFSRIDQLHEDRIAAGLVDDRSGDV